MTTESSSRAGGAPHFTPEEARVLGRATNIEMVGLLASVLAGFAAAHTLNYSVTGLALGVASFVLCGIVVRATYWRITRPLAHLASGDNPRFDRAQRSSQVFLDSLALAGLPLLALSKRDIPGWWIAIALLAAVAGSFVLERALHQHLKRLNARDEARGASS